jgi:acyl carrier protein
MTRTEIIDRLRAWIADKDGRICATDITDETPIVEQRILSSLQVVNLLLYIEQMRGAPIDIESLQPRSFRSLATIYLQFFAETAHD